MLFIIIKFLISDACCLYNICAVFKHSSINGTFLLIHIFIWIIDLLFHYSIGTLNGKRSLIFVWYLFEYSISILIISVSLVVLELFFPWMVLVLNFHLEFCSVHSSLIILPIHIEYISLSPSLFPVNHCLYLYWNAAYLSDHLPYLSCLHAILVWSCISALLNMPILTHIWSSWAN